ncbi:MAG: MBL fold metallo-hydrolase [Acidobacteriota bacterium]
MNRIKIFLIAFIIILFSIGSNPVNPFSVVKSEKEVKARVTFIGNSGFVVETGGKKISIDAMFKGFPGRYTLPDKAVKKIRTSSPPFDNIDVILATHLHADHLKTGYVSDYLVKNKSSRFISTYEVVDTMKKNLPEFILYKERVKGLKLEWGDTEEININNINIRGLGMPHGSNPVTQAAFLVRINKKRFLHLGDVAGDKVEWVFRTASMKKEKIDIAFIPYWFLTKEKYVKLIEKYIHSKYIVTIHLGLTDRGENKEEIIKKINTNFPDAIIFDKELQSKVFLL